MQKAMDEVPRFRQNQVAHSSAYIGAPDLLLTCIFCFYFFKVDEFTIPKWVSFSKSAKKLRFGEYFTNLFKVIELARTFVLNHIIKN